MGGVGSGTWYRWSKKTTIEECKRVDIRFMRKKGFLKAGTSGTLSWNRGSEPCGNINFHCQNNYLQLTYRFRQNGGEWQPIEQRISFDRTACNYGGERLWFLCGNCSRRVAVLCSDGAYFLCRHCYGLTYQSKQDGKHNRLIEQKHKLGKRIFEHYEYGNGWGKKKGMHQATFDRLLSRYLGLEERWIEISNKYIHYI